MLNVRIITPEGLYQESQASSVHATSTEGQFTLLPKHMPLVAMLVTSSLKLKINDEVHTYAISGGLLHLKDDHINLLVDTIESRDEIDLARALEAKARYEEILKETNNLKEQKLVENSLKKAINRITIKEEK